MLRATLKSLMSRKLRLVLSGLAVVLGVMFVAGAFVLTDTLGRSFTSLFSTAYANTDVQVAAKSKVATGVGNDQGVASLPGSLVDTVRQVPGVASATGEVQVDGARVIGHNGKVVTTYGAPQFGMNWTGGGFAQLEPGSRAPAADDEIVINAGLAKTADLKIGDQVSVLTLEPKKTFTLVGIFGYSGGRDSLGGEQSVAFTTPVAQQLMLGTPDAYSDVDVRAGPGVSDSALRDRVATAVGGDYQVKTGKQLADDASAGFQKALSFFNYVLLGFAGVALFVGIFLILNTFSIIVAQRVRELALMRSLGASRRQIINSVLLEALVIGTIASVLGLGAGIGVGALLAYLFANLGASGLHLAGIGVPASAVIASFAVGVVITLVAATLPALRAARVAPIAAMREVAATDRPLTRVTVAGSVVTAAGIGVLGVGLAGDGGDATLWAILGGVLVSFIGVALLTPLIGRPVVSVLGRLFAWSVPGQLGRRNSARNPRRTAITAAALMVGLALITGVNVILTSATSSIHNVADTQVSADLVISGEGGNSSIPPTFDKAVLDKTRSTPGVAQVAGFYHDQARVDGKVTGVDAVDDPQALRDMFGLSAKSGTIGTEGSGQLIVDEKQATSLGLHVGSQVPVQLTRGDARTFTVTGIYRDNDVYAGWVLSAADVSGFRSAQPQQAMIKLTPGADVNSVKTAVNGLLADSPGINVADRTEYVDQQTSQFNTILTMIQILLALAILIAVLGIVNTLALSVLERTRELGLLRAIGLRRAQAMRMVTVEAVVISVFGALLGLAVGSGLGAAVVRALRDQGFTVLAFPWSRMALYLVLAAAVGVVAAILPAIRAAKVNVLAAIAYE
ncbi:ABC transporter permease [Rugosimonospora africana]|uniref:ABC transporter n=1 Tax=Rugosimonospora africana TaxID=556532 RepID=A0A8J3QP39_9ACTN|nr:ABC transporter permease [Rugosimonospora africana]GIH13981.1 ABC transporter [Rugosimonospora africana]